MKKKKFSYIDQHEFAKFSGDYNPLHLDQVASRRFIHGQLVVHGIHLIFWSLDALFETFTGKASILELDVKFISPVYLGHKIKVEVIAEQDSCYKLNLIDDYKILVKILIKLGPIQKAAPIIIKDKIPAKLKPELLEDKDFSLNIAGQIPLMLCRIYLKNNFPYLFKSAVISELSIILATTRLVGMKCPGENSIYSGLSFSTSETHNYGNELRYKVNNFDERFGLIDLNINASNIQGRIKAFLRPKPQKQLTFQEIKEKYGSNDLEGRHALIIGGSRGIGEITAKYFAANGAKVSITYNSGIKDADRIVQEINDSSTCTASCYQFNVAEPKKIYQLFENSEMPDLLFYFATPRIGKSEKKQFNLDKFHLFNSFYIDGFIEVFEQLNQHIKHIFYPSTIFIESKPSGMWEYISSKMAGELICNYIENEYPEVSIFKPRIPKVVTDQTIGLLRLELNNTESVMVTFYEDFISQVIEG
ncbi:SDR family NAD(P)-dependent oxidoreductase [Flavobacteriaceae bacterium]|nr:SDR family NAD(P)-dependent oxidoreductase [Flavobacteriaceae bacterium]